MHVEYYDELLKYNHKFENFLQDFNIEDFMKKKRENEEAIKINKPQKVLQRNLSSQFGTKAPEKMQRLFFMLRENQEVIDVFVDNLLNYICDCKSALTLAEFIIHFMFLDLTSSEPNLKLTQIVYRITLKTFPSFISSENMEHYQKQNILTNFRQHLFTQMIKSLDAKQCAQAMFMSKY